MMQETPEHQRQADRQRQSTATEIALIRRDMSAMNEKLDTILRELPALNQRLNVVERTEVVCQAGVNDLPDRVRVIEKWIDKADGSLGLMKWALSGGIMGVIALIGLVIMLVSGGWKP
jgi:hypothetical protein